MNIACSGHGHGRRRHADLRPVGCRRTMYFSIDDSGLRYTVGMGAMLDHEAEKSTYMVTVTATDSEDLTDTIEVTINVTNVNEAPMFAEATADRSIDENSAEDMAVGDPVTATDPDAGDTLAYSLSGDDAMYFSIDDMGQITVGADAMLDYEAEKSTYMVTVTATDSEDLTDTIEVTINVTDVEENPLLVKYDTIIEDGEIDRDEAIAAIRRYLAARGRYLSCRSDSGDPTLPRQLRLRRLAKLYGQKDTNVGIPPCTKQRSGAYVAVGGRKPGPNPAEPAGPGSTSEVGPRLTSGATFIPLRG